jgi:hypothetical protein
MEMDASTQDRLRNLVETHTKDERLLGEFMHFHFSVSQKLYSLEYFAAEVAGLQPIDTWERLVHDDGQSVKLSTDMMTYGLKANMYLDCLLINAMASLDTLAHEINILYGLWDLGLASSRRQDIYIGGVKEELTRSRSGKKLTIYFTDVLQKPWYEVFKGYRHCTTHESLVAPDVEFKATWYTGQLKQLRMKLPDDPKVRPFAYTQDRELKSYCDETVKVIKELVSQAYSLMADDIEGSGNSLPIL